MTIFELVKIALVELYAQGTKQHGDKLDQKIKKRMEYLSESYQQLNDENRKLVDYKDPATRFAYVYKYVAAHGDYLVQIMEKLNHNLKGKVFQTGSVRVSCVGGGPGSDIIAILKYLDEYKDDERVEKVTCYLLDKEQAWADTWTELDESFDVGVRLHANFQSLDVTNSESWKFQQKFMQADLFTLSYFVSEVRSLDKDGKVTEFWKMLFEGAKPGALFVYDDNGNKDFNSYFDSQWSGMGLKCLISEDNVTWTPRYSEQASKLGEYRKKFDGLQPKLQGTISYRVLRKE